MSDGPLKNSQLGSRWNRFVAAVDNDAVGSIQRSALASDALVREILNDDTRVLLKDLWAFMRRDQLDLDPLTSVESIFHSHRKTAFGDSLQREAAFRLANQMTPDAAIGQALNASVKDHIRRARSRIQEECIRSRESGAMPQDQFDRMVSRANATFDGLDTDAICDALRALDKHTFTDSVSKQEGIDEGPSL